MFDDVAQLWEIFRVLSPRRGHGAKSALPLAVRDILDMLAVHGYTGEEAQEALELICAMDDALLTRERERKK